MTPPCLDPSIPCNHVLCAAITLTTYAAYGAATHLHDGPWRRDWLLFVSSADDRSERLARQLGCDLVVVGPAEPGVVPMLRAGMQMGPMLWRDGLRLWFGESERLCKLVPEIDLDLHLSFETGRVVAHDGLPWRDAFDRDAGFARAAVAWRKLVRS